MTRIARTMAAALMPAALIIIHAPVSAQGVPSEMWMGVYLGHTKVGYSKYSIEKAQYKGRPGYRLDSSSLTRVTAREEVEQSLETTVYLDSNFEPVHQVFKMSSAGHSMVVTANFGAEEIVAESASEGTKSTRRIPIPEGAGIVGDDTFLPPTTKLRVGDKLSFRWFNPLTLSLDDLRMEVLRQEDLELGGKAHRALVVKSLTTTMGEVTSWRNEDGSLLKVASLTGIVMVSEPKDVAQAMPAGPETPPPADLAVMTSIRTATRIPSPRTVKYVKARLAGLSDKSLVISDDRQKAGQFKGPNTPVEYRISASKLDVSETVSLPARKTGMDVYLDDTSYIQPSNAEVASLARQIVGSEKNTGRIVSKLRAWVNRNMRSRGDIGIVRTSVDILHARAGVCRDYAVLYTALARAAGVPTKLVAGLVFWENGFYYHAWAESFVGEWVPVDATLATDFVDATHIKLAEGHATAMFDIAKTMGALKAEIVEFK